MHIRTLAGVAIVVAFAASSSAFLAQANTSEYTSADRDFVMKAMTAGDAEIAQARAQLSTHDATVRAFARRMILDHVAANTHLAQLAEQKGIPYPHVNVNVTSEPGNAKPNTATRASTPTGRAMSARAYMQREVSEHQVAIALFKTEAKSGTDRDIEVFVGNTLPLLQGHLKMAQDYLAGRRVTMPPLAPPSENNPQPAKSPQPEELP
ncbi:MAG: DUF4142 domain-containing protein [Candidatus Eremiobacteraeota bacterium]|nr:DUF4142 domain-containing protein [Candidatus Eremiobacteraeota bacterium]MBV9737215.1 DUF4142 domain-containing protein [Candidatus Eremiobacteraeota bacterium]